MAAGGQDRHRRTARSRFGAGALSLDFGIGATLHRLGRDGGRIVGGRSVMSAHALIIEPFESLAFMRAALVACLALALSNGPVGTLLVLRRMSLDGDVLGHAVMPGAAVGFLYAGPSPEWLSLGGLASGLGVAALAGLIAGGRARRDAGLVAFYLVALSLGVLLVAWRGSNVDVMRVLFGTVLAIDGRALWQIAATSSVIVLVIAALYRPLAVGAFDPAFLRAMAVRVPYGMVCQPPRRAAGGWEWQSQWPWRPVSGLRHRLPACWSRIMPIYRPVQQLFSPPDWCWEFRSSPPAGFGDWRP